MKAPEFKVETHCNSIEIELFIQLKGQGVTQEPRTAHFPLMHRSNLYNQHKP